MAFNDEQKAGFDRLEQSGYLPMLRQWILTHTVPFFWHTQDGYICHNGTVSLVDTGTEKLAITAEHVYRKYLADLEAGKILACQFGGVIVRPETMMIDRNRPLDVATFRMPTVAVSEGAAFHIALAWPPPPPRIGEWMFYAGYPKAHRKEEKANVRNDLQSLFGKITDISGTKVAFDLKFEELHWPLRPGETINEVLGGMSGGPVFRVIETGLTRLEFVGTVMEDSPTFQVMMTRSAEVINADGTLAR